MTIEVGDKIRMSGVTATQQYTYCVRVVRVESDNTAWVRFPARVLAFPFPPNHGRKFGLYPCALLEKGKVKVD